MKNRYLLTAMLIVCVTHLLQAQDTARLKRTPYKLVVPVDKKTTYEEDLKAVPYVLPNNTIQLYPGETVKIEVEQKNGVIQSIRAVKDILDPAKTIIISLLQNAPDSKHERMTLSVKNPFAWPLLYDAHAYLLFYQKWVRTTVVPVPAGLSAIKSWRDMVTSIGIGRLAFKR